MCFRDDHVHKQDDSLIILSVKHCCMRFNTQKKIKSQNISYMIDIFVLFISLELFAKSTYAVKTVFHEKSKVGVKLGKAQNVVQGV